MSSTHTKEVSGDGRFVLGHRIKDSWGDFSTYEERWRLIDAGYNCEMAHWSNEGDRDVESVRFTSGSEAVEACYVDGRVKRVNLPRPRALDATEHALRAAIFAAPDEDAPRLVYADWLQERGDARGELVALQLQPQASARATELVALHRWQWLCDDGLPLTREAKFERGFVSELRLQVFELAALERMLAQEALVCVRALDLSFSPVGGDALSERVAAAPTAAGLRALNLFLSDVSDAGVATLKASPHLRRLTEIKR
jgi:uncharacterized protein (TIGR02996 family)